MKNTISVEEGIKLVQKLQQKTISPAEERMLVAEIKNRYRPHIHTNYLYDNNELETEFLITSWNHLYKANTNMGDPIAFACYRGRGAMLDYYRKVNSERLLLFCPVCNATYTYDRRNVACKELKCNNYQKENCLESVEKEEVVENIDNYGDLLMFTDKSLEEMTIQEIYKQLMECINESPLSLSDKKMAVKALSYKEDLYEYAKAMGKSHSWSISFKNRIILILTPLSEGINLD